MQERIEKFEELLEKELKDKLDRVNNAGTINPEDLKVIKDAVKLMLKIQKYKEWMIDEGYGDGYSTRRGRSATTGRYVSRNSYPTRHYDGYSGRRSYGYSGHNRMIDELERMRDEAQTEHERMMIDEWISNAEMNR